MSNPEIPQTYEVTILRHLDDTGQITPAAVRNAINTYFSLRGSTVVETTPALLEAGDRVRAIGYGDGQGTVLCVFVDAIAWVKWDDECYSEPESWFLTKLERV